jgi:hypothetical protein
VLSNNLTVGLAVVQRINAPVTIADVKAVNGPASAREDSKAAVDWMITD